MKSVLSVLTVFVLSTICKGASPSPISFDSATPSFGVITTARGEDLLLTVRVNNLSDQALGIDSASVGCGCMAVSWDRPITLAKGASAPIKIFLRRPQMHLGAQSYSLTLFGGGRILGTVPVTYTFRPPIYAEPGAIWISTATGLSSGQARVVVADRATWSLLHLRYDSAAISAKLDEVEDSTDTKTVAVTINSRLAADRDTEIAIFRSGNEEPDLVIPVHIHLERPLTPSPAVVLFGTVKRSENHTRDIVLDVSQVFHIAGVSCSSDSIRAREGAIRGGAHVIVVELLPSKSESIIAAHVDIHIDEPTSSTITIPVFAEFADDNH